MGLDSFGGKNAKFALGMSRFLRVPHVCALKGNPKGKSQFCGAPEKKDHSIFGLDLSENKTRNFGELLDQKNTRIRMVRGPRCEPAAWLRGTSASARASWDRWARAPAMLGASVAVRRRKVGPGVRNLSYSNGGVDDSPHFAPPEAMIPP